MGSTVIFRSFRLVFSLPPKPIRQILKQIHLPRRGTIALLKLLFILCANIFSRILVVNPILIKVLAHCTTFLILTFFYHYKKLLITALQSFLNQLIWSPNILQSPSLSQDSVQQLRQFLIMVIYIFCFHHFLNVKQIGHCLKKS